jgi:hypothetical protein
MKVEQFTYLSAEAKALRERDGTPPWGVHPCEVDSIGEPEQAGAFADAWRAAKALHEELEQD